MAVSGGVNPFRRRIIGPGATLIALGLVVGAAHSVVVPVSLRMQESGATVVRLPGGGDRPGDQGEPVGDPGAAPDPGTLVLERMLTLEQTRLLWETFEIPVAFIDARHTEEYLRGHIPRAHTWDPRTFDRVVPEWSEFYGPDTIMVVYCGGGDCADSENAGRRLQMMGFMRVHIFKDGFPAWASAGYEVEVGDPMSPGGGGS